MYVVTGASGNTGKPLAEALLDAGGAVRVIARNAEKLNPLVRRGAEAAIGDLADTAFLTDAFRGATAVYAMIPPDYSQTDFRGYQGRIARSLADAIRGAGVRHVVSLSSVGAHLRSGAGVVQGLADMEAVLDSLGGVDVLHLRPAYFMENFLGQIPTIRQAGVMGSPLRGDVPYAMVATRDIVAAAARRLLALDFRGSEVQYLLGAEDRTFRDAARVLGAVVGRPELAYVEFPFEEARKGMLEGWGVTPSVADAYAEFMRSMNEGRITGDARRTPENTTPTTLEEWAPKFAGAFGAEPAAVGA